MDRAKCNVLDGLDVSGDAGTAAKTALVTATKADHGNGHLFVAYYVCSMNEKCVEKLLTAKSVKLGRHVFVAYYTFGRFHIWIYIWLVHKASG